MKKALFLMVIALTLLATNTIGYAQNSERTLVDSSLCLQLAKIDVIDTKQVVKEAKKISNLNNQEIKNESKKELKINEKNMAVLKENFSRSNRMSKITYEKMIGDLELINTDLIAKIAGCENSEHGKWKIFKTELNHNLVAFGKAIIDLTVQNKD